MNGVLGSGHLLREVERCVAGVAKGQDLENSKLLFVVIRIIISIINNNNNDDNVIIISFSSMIIIATREVGGMLLRWYCLNRLAR